MSERWYRVTMGAVLAAATAYLLYRLRFVLATVALAAMLAYAILPAVEMVARWRVGGRPLPRVGAVVIVFALLVLGAAAIVEVVADPMREQLHQFSQHAATYRVQLGAYLSQARAAIEQSVPADLLDVVDTALSRIGTVMVDALGRVMRTTADWLAHIVEIIFIPILAFYFLVDAPNLKHELVRFLPSAAREPVLMAADPLGRIVAGYVRAQIILMLIAGVVVWVGLVLIGVRYALLLAIVAGFTRAVPIIGPVVGGIPIVGLALVQSAPLGLTVFVFFVALQVFESKVLLPRILGRELNLSAVTIILTMLVGNALFGLVGMFLAAPVAAFAVELLALAERGFVERRRDARRAG